MIDLRRALAECPLAAILRGITPAESRAVGLALLDVGFRIIEVPLNSPDPFASISLLAECCGARALIGAGTVLTPIAVGQVAAAGGRLIVMPHGDERIIAAARSLGLACLPGVSTPTEAFSALAAGADGLKLFPAETIPPAAVKAWRAVLPERTALIPVGGIGAENLGAYLEAGASGLGIGSALYRPGKPAEQVRQDGEGLMAARRGARTSAVSCKTTIAD